VNNQPPDRKKSVKVIYASVGLAFVLINYISGAGTAYPSRAPEFTPDF